VSGTTVPATSTTATGSAAAATTSATTTARSPAAPAISAPIRTIPRRAFPSSYPRNRIPIEVRLVVRKIPATFDGQSRLSRNFSVTFLAAVSPRLAATHLRPLLFQDGLA
jgi:hypothetical protein